MAKRPNQRLKLLYLAKIMLRLTDDEHGLQVEQIINELDKYDIAAERKSIYSDLEALQLFGIDIEKKHIGRYVYYCVGNRNLELAELKLLVDAVQSSKFITEKKSSQLIEKLERYVSQYEAKQLNQQVYVHGRIKTMNESIYYNVDEIHNAITADVMISFQYFQWNLKKEMEPRHEGERYIISPWGLIWDNENYYMVGYDAKAELVKHFRVDKMLRIQPMKCKRKGQKLFPQGNIANYAEKHFGMFSGKEESVTLLCQNGFIGVIVDRFGRDVKIRPVDEDHFQAKVEVVVSNNFFGWVLGLGEGVKITAPQEVVSELQKEIQRMRRQYFADDLEMELDMKDNKC